MKAPDENFSCTDPSFPKLCGRGQTDDKTDMRCVPSTSKCPITDVRFDTEGNLIVDTDPDLGSPILEVWLS